MNMRALKAWSLLSWIRVGRIRIGYPLKKESEILSQSIELKSKSVSNNI